MDQYFENCIKHKDTIIENFSPAKCETNFFNQEEITQLIEYQFSNSQRVKWTASSNNIQPVVDIDTMFDNIDWLQDKFLELFGNFYHKHTGNFYITTQLHDCHVDLLTDEETQSFDWTHNVIPYKSVVIPLMISNYSHAVTAFFDQRHIGHSVTLDRNFNSHQTNSMYHVARQYPELYDIQGDLCDPTIEFENKNILFPHLDKNTLQGLTVENYFDYVVGDIMVFDACQIHCSATPYQRPNYRWMKSGINIQFYREV